MRSCRVGARPVLCGIGVESHPSPVSHTPSCDQEKAVVFCVPVSPTSTVPERPRHGYTGQRGSSGSVVEFWSSVRETRVASQSTRRRGSHRPAASGGLRVTRMLSRFQQSFETKMSWVGRKAWRAPSENQPVKTLRIRTVKHATDHGDGPGLGSV